MKEIIKRNFRDFSGKLSKEELEFVRAFRLLKKMDMSYKFAMENFD